ncbi:MAG: hypothetical protein K2P81_14890 [Bacteriovoracaceae bacterium]|nr:hypothetical protein [Bacteriovoracaceae bacterium]
MKSTIYLFILLLSQASFAMQIEKSCVGDLSDSSKVAVKFYSDFDGCQNESQAAISIALGNAPEELHIGKRVIDSAHDTYHVFQKFGERNLESIVATFASKTSTVTGDLKLVLDVDEQGDTTEETVILNCMQVWDYEYEDCSK